MRRLLPIALVFAAPASAPAQDVSLPAPYVPGTAIGFGSRGTPWTAVDPAHPLPVAPMPRQETVPLVTANAAAAPAGVIGGDYVFAQTCTGYGSLSLQALGPDGATYQTLLTRTAADTAGGTGIALGSGAIVRVATFGTAGCNAVLSRVP